MGIAFRFFLLLCLSASLPLCDLAARCTFLLNRPRLAERCGHGVSYLRRTLHRANSCCAHRPVFFRGGSLPSADNCAGMSHAAPGRRGLPGDEADHRLLYIFLDVFGSHFLSIAANFADHYDRVGIAIFVEQLDRIQKAGANNRIAANSDTGGLPDAQMRELINGLVSERPTAAHNAHMALLVN